MWEWLAREGLASPEELPELSGRLEHCRSCAHWVGGRCRLFPKPNPIAAQVAHLKARPCPWHTSHPVTNIYALCADCEHLRPAGKCAMFAAGCDAEQRRLAVLRTGACRHRRPIPRVSAAYLGEPIPPDRFVTIQDLISDTAALAARIPLGEFAAVIGVARSGLLPATLMAAYAHVPLFSIGSYDLVLRPVGCGFRLSKTVAEPPPGPLLVVDDTAHGGASIARIVDTLGAYRSRLYTAAIYATSHAIERGGLSFVAHRYDGVHFLEWCFANTGWAQALAWDIDGIMCPDPQCPDFAPAYIEHLDNAPARHIPRKWPSVIISARCEWTRNATEKWLARHRAKVRRVILWPYDGQLRKTETMAEWKAAQIVALRRSGETIGFYIESCPRQAEAIAIQAGLPVICPAARKVFGVAR